MKVVINFNIDYPTLEAAIRYLLTYKSPVNKYSIIKEIKDKVYLKGNSIIDFPEYWGDDIWSNDIVDDNKVDKYIEKYSKLIRK